MVKVRVIAQNEEFKADLLLQLQRFVDGFETDDNFPDVIVVDEDKNSANSMRAQYSSVPIILLTAENIAARDNLSPVLHKPFSLWQLVDMLHAVNNKLDSSEEGKLVFNQYELQPSARKIIDLVGNIEIKLTEKEVNVLKYMYKVAPQFVNKTDLQTNVWQYSRDVTTHTIETHIYRLRQKVEQKCRRQLILTEGGQYKLILE